MLNVMIWVKAYYFMRDCLSDDLSDEEDKRETMSCPLEGSVLDISHEEEVTYYQIKCVIKIFEYKLFKIVEILCKQLMAINITSKHPSRRAP